VNDAARIVLGLVGAVVVAIVFDAAVRTLLLPRVASVALTRLIAIVVGTFFSVLARRSPTYAQKDRRLAMYPPVLLLSYQATWLALLLCAFSGLFVSAGAPSIPVGFELSGSALLTLGNAAAKGPAELALTYLEAACGLTLLALLIAFIPTIYGAFQRRELSIARLSVRAGVPATPWGIIEIAQSVGSYERLDELWREWETWFMELRETHTTLTILNYYRTPIAGQTWVAAAASVLDSAALFNSSVDQPASASAGLCIRSGWLALRALANYFRIPYPLDPDGTEPISISRDEFDDALSHLERSGVPVLSDRDAAWLDFVGWRVNYDAMIERLHVQFTSPRLDWHLALTSAPTKPSNRRGTHKLRLPIVAPSVEPTKGP
jgi:hypothetical protein